jgi:diadenosine tetraphosphate (Ap4A) HIT family hydrolase
VEGVEVLPKCELCDQTGGTLLWQDESCRVVLVEDADYPGFCRVIWNRHVKEMTDLSTTERQHLMATVFAVEAAVRETLRPDKINLASLGNMTPHLHWHVIPRYTHDKHFPQPIWGTMQREGKPSHPLDWKVHLMESIGLRLKEEFK